MRNQIKVASSSAVALIAHDLKISGGRVRQIIIKLKLKPVQKIGNVPFYSEEQVQLIRQRNRKPGPMKIDRDIPDGLVSPSGLAKTLGVSRQRASQLLNPEKHRARGVLGDAIRAGRVKKADRCERCGKKNARLEGHHDDYSKPLEVRWLCTTCHSEVHPHAPYQNGAKK